MSLPPLRKGYYGRKQVVVLSDSSDELCQPGRIQKILDEKNEGKNILYKIRWEGNSHIQDTWVSQAVVENYQYAIKDWEETKISISGKKRPNSSSDFLQESEKASKSIKTSEPPRALTLSEINVGKQGVTIFLDRPGRSMSSNSRRESLAKPLLRGPNPYAEHIKNHPNHQIFVEKLRNLDGPMVKLVNEVDDDPSPPTSFEFINSFRFAPDVEQLDPAFVCGCDCPQSGCDDPKECECLDDYDMDPELRRFSYTKHGKVVRDNRFCLIECNSKCSCGPECSSRVVQNGRKIPLEIFKTKDKGWGLRSPESLKKGTFIDLYLGEVIGPEEAERRGKKASLQGLNYLFDLDKFSPEENIGGDNSESQTRHQDRQTVYTIDGKYCGGVTRFVNHSCDPNLWVYAVMSDRRDGKVYDLALFTNRAIPAFEELTFCYVKTAPIESAALQGAVTWPCYCGSENCVKTLW